MYGEFSLYDTHFKMIQYSVVQKSWGFDWAVGEVIFFFQMKNKNGSKVYKTKTEFVQF